MVVAAPGVDLDFELAAIAKRQDGEKAVLFPAPKRGQANLHYALLGTKITNLLTDPQPGRV